MSGYIGTKASVVTPGAERKKVFSISTTTTSLTGLVYTPGFVHVFHNGVRLVDGTDYTATNGTSITLTTAAQNGDEVVVISYATFQVADAYTKAESDDRYVDVTGDTMTGALAVDGNLTVDGGTLFVDAASNNVGIGTSSISHKLHVNGQTGTETLYVMTFGGTGTGFLGGLSDWTGGATDNSFAVATYQANMCFFTNNNPAERMRVDSSGNVGINATDPDVNSTSAKLLHIAGTATNSGPAGFMMTGSSDRFGQAFCSTEVFGIAGITSATEICRFTGTGANGYQAYIRIVVTGHTGGIGNGTNVKEYVWGGSTTSPTQISSTTNLSIPVISFDNTTANVCIIKLASSNGVNSFSGVMKVEWLNPIDFSATHTR